MERVAREFSSYPSLRNEEDRERKRGIKESRIPNGEEALHWIKEGQMRGAGRSDAEECR